MKDYPVMLYLGGLDSHAIAHDEDEADALKAKGYVEHDEAVKIEPKVTEHIEMIEGVIEAKDKKILELEEINARSDEWNKEVAAQNELHRATIKELNAKLAVYEETADKNGDNVVSYDEMTIPQLSTLLKQRKVEHNVRDGKDTLIKLATDSE